MVKTVARASGAVFALAVGGLALWFLIWPINFSVFVFGVFVALAFSVYSWPAIKPEYLRRGNGRPLEPGEQEAYGFLARRRRGVLLLVFWLASSILLAINGLVGYLLFGLPYNAISLVVLIGGAVWFYFVFSAIIRPLADLGWWFVRPDENSAAMVEKDNACWKIIITTNDPRRRTHFSRLAAWKNSELGYERYILLPAGQGIHFLGFTAWPWKVKLREPWYEREADIKNAATEPVRFCSLRERAWNLGSEHDTGGIVPDVGSADPIDIRAKLYVRALVWDPFAAVYGASFTGESVCNETVARWRRALSGLRYFTRGGGSEEELDINPEIQSRAHVALLRCLAVWPEEEDNLFYPRLEERQETDATYYRIEDDFPHLSPAWACLHTFGFHLLDVEVTDLQPADETIRKAIEQKTAAAAQGAAAFAKAKGDAQALIREADGQARAIERRSEALRQEGGMEVWRGDVARDIAGSVGNITVVSGSATGRVADIAATLAAVGGLPVTTGGQAPASVPPVAAEPDSEEAPASGSRQGRGEGNS